MDTISNTFHWLFKASAAPFETFLSVEFMLLTVVSSTAVAFIVLFFLKKKSPVNGWQRSRWFLASLLIPILFAAGFFLFLNQRAHDVLEIIIVMQVAVFLAFTLFYFHIPLISGLLLSRHEQNIFLFLGVVGMWIGIASGMSGTGEFDLYRLHWVWFPLTWLLLPRVSGLLSPIQNQLILSRRKQMLGRISLLVFVLTWLLALMMLVATEEKRELNMRLSQEKAALERAHMASTDVPDIIAVREDNEIKIFKYSFKEDLWTFITTVPKDNIRYGENHDYEYRRVSPSGKHVAVAWRNNGDIPNRDPVHNLTILNTNGAVVFSTTSTIYYFPNQEELENYSGDQAFVTDGFLWSPDGRFLSWLSYPATDVNKYGCDGRINVYDTTSDRSLTIDVGKVMDLKWTGASRILYSVCNPGGGSYEYDLSTGISNILNMVGIDYRDQGSSLLARWTPDMNFKLVDRSVYTADKSIYAGIPPAETYKDNYDYQWYIPEFSFFGDVSQ